MTRHLVAVASAALFAASPRPAIAGPARPSAVPVPGAPGELRGRVTRADGVAVPAFTVNGVQFRDADGTFKVLVPPEGIFRVVIRAEGFAPTVIHVQGAAGKKLRIPEIYLGQGEDVLGEVVDADTGLPVVAARVALADPAQIARLRLVRPEPLSAPETTGYGGWFHIHKAPRGLTLLVIHHPDYLPAFVELNTRGARPAVKLQRGGSIAGLVRSAGGEPLAGARVTALSEATEDGGEAVAGPDGRFELRTLKPGSYLVVASAPGAVLTPEPVTVAENRVAVVGFIARGKRHRMELPELQVAPHATAAADRGDAAVAAR